MSEQQPREGRTWRESHRRLIASSDGHLRQPEDASETEGGRTRPVGWVTEPSPEEIRRRTAMIGRFRGETSSSRVRGSATSELLQQFGDTRPA